MSRQAKKAQKACYAAALDIWESQYLAGSYWMKKDAKRSYNRAHRRYNKALSREQD